MLHFVTCVVNIEYFKPMSLSFFTDELIFFSISKAAVEMSSCPERYGVNCG